MSRRIGNLSIHGKIDLCRGLFAYLVVAAHAREVAWSMHPEMDGVLEATIPLLRRCLAGHGIIWVMGFFVISGYCIHLSAARLQSAARFPFRVYLVARLTRILPLYYLALLFAVLVEWLIAPARPGAWPNGLNGFVLIDQVLVIQNLTQTYGSFAASWSITNELFYYAFYGLVCGLAAGRGDWPGRVGMAICLVIAAVMQALYSTVAHTPVVLGFGMLFGLGINWFLGVLVAIHGPSLARSRRVRGLVRVWPALLAAAFFSRLEPRLPSGVFFLICGVAFALMLVAFHRGVEEASAPALVPFRLSKVVGWMGLSSYPTYLFHGPIMMLLGSVMIRQGWVADWRLTWLILSVVPIALGIVLGFVAERPILAWRSDLLRRLKSSGEGSRQRLPGPVLGMER
jgi:peptidoglycan/LPS O-acetylase OafA/YrhL